MNRVIPEESTLELNPGLVHFIENIGMYFKNYGIPRIGGRMFGLFLVTTTPLSAGQIAHMLKASRSSVSTNVRALLAVGWVEKVTFPGDRTEYYRFSPTAWERVMVRRKEGLVPLKAMAEQALAALPTGNPASKRLEVMVEWAELLIEHYEDLISAWQAHVAERSS